MSKETQWARIVTNTNPQRPRKEHRVCGRRYEQDGPILPMSVVDDRDRSFKLRFVGEESNINYRLLFCNDLTELHSDRPSNIKIKACFLAKFWK